MVYNIHHCFTPSDQCFTVKTCQFLNHPKKWTIDDDNNDEPVPMEQNISDPNFQPSTSNEPHLITQGEVNDLVRGLNLSKSQAEFLGSRLQGWNLLQKNTNISKFRYRKKYIAQYFASAGDLV
jgi:hypothetical protein